MMDKKENIWKFSSIIGFPIRRLSLRLSLAVDDDRAVEKTLRRELTSSGRHPVRER
jgi:hypothetical protein